MENLIYAFALGILSVFVISGVVLGVLAFFKANKVNKSLEEQVHSITDDLIRQNEYLDRRFDQLWDTMDKEFMNSSKEIDSRLDKLEHRLKTDINNKKTIING